MRTKDPFEAATNFSSRQNMDGQLVLRKNVLTGGSWGGHNAGEQVLPLKNEDLKI